MPPKGVGFTDPLSKTLKRLSATLFSPKKNNHKKYTFFLSDSLKDFVKPPIVREIPQDYSQGGDAKQVFSYFR